MGGVVKLVGRIARPGDASNGGCAPRTVRKARGSSGQVVPIFAAALLVLMGMAALVVDVAWYWSNTVKVQRAADAAALAGAVWLPGDVASAYGTAVTEAQKNGYAAGGGVTVTPIQDSLAVPGGGGNARQLNVTVSAPVRTFFMRVFGFNSITATRVAKAEFVQPVPMGSPLSYYGVFEDCEVNGSSIVCSAIPSAIATGSPPLPTLASQGFFGAIEGQGSNRSTGDAFATAYNPRTTPNSQYDSNGYAYQIEVTTAGGEVWIYDPTFCATTSGPGGGHLGAGDHWLNGGSVNALPVSTYFRLWDTRGTAFTTSDDVLVTSSGNTFANEYQVDKSPAYATALGAGGENNNFADGNEPGSNGTSVPPDCRNHIAHNQWWRLASGLAAGTYRLQVTTTDPANASANANQMFENMWSLQVVNPGGTPRIYGSGRMVSYANIRTGAQIFHLAQIDRRSGAGKTLQIELFDPGDTSAPTWLQILSPNGNVYSPATFNYTADGNASAGHTSGTNVTCIQTRGGTGTTPPAGCANDTNASQFYQNSWIKITIPLSLAYGSSGLTPPGEPSEGWWKIKYTVNNGNDTTTWMVSLRGNPVHLVP